MFKGLRIKYQSIIWICLKLGEMIYLNESNKDGHLVLWNRCIRSLRTTQELTLPLASGQRKEQHFLQKEGVKSVKSELLMEQR
jgi:hypothetical protein